MDTATVNAAKQLVVLHNRMGIVTRFLEGRPAYVYSNNEWKRDRNPTWEWENYQYKTE